LHYELLQKKSSSLSTDWLYIFYYYKINWNNSTSLIRKYKAEYETKLNDIIEVKNPTEKEKQYLNLYKNYFAKIENVLSSTSYGNNWLKNKEIASIVKNTFHFYDSSRYDLICYTIMPNHIHLVILPKLKSYNEFLKVHLSKKKTEETFYFVTKIMQDIKKYSAKESNKILRCSGKFWQSESYDHVIRNKKELTETIKYVLDNPVKAGLCKRREDWKWSYYNPKFLT